MTVSNIFRPSRSIANRLTWRVTGIVFLIITCISALIFGIVWLISTVMFSAFYESRIDLSNVQMNKEFSAVEVAIRNNVPDVEECLDNPDKMYQVVKDILKTNPNIVGSAIAFDSDFYPSKGKLFAPFAYRSGDSIKVKQLGTTEYDYLHQPWYEIPRNDGRSHWSDAYKDTGGGDIVMTTYSLPLKDKQGKTYAVLTADLPLDWVHSTREKLDSIINVDMNMTSDSIGHCYSFIIGRDGTFISHPDKAYAMKENIFTMAKQAQAKDMEDLATLMTKGEEGTSVIRLKNQIHLVIYSQLAHTVWSMAVVVPLSDLTTPANIFVFVFIGIMAVGLLILGMICHLTIKRTVQPLQRFADSADEIAQGNLGAELPVIRSHDEMLRLRNSFDLMQKSLVKQMDELKSVNEEKGRIKGELEIARNIQMSMLPKAYPPFPNRTDIDIYGILKPAKEVGGDLFDFYIRDEKLFFCIGDVSGKGVPASLLMAVIRSLFRTISAREAMPDHIISDINDAITEDNDAMMFTTFFLGVLDLPTGRLRYSNAGHNAPLIIAGKGKCVGPLPVDPNLPLGVTKGLKYSVQDTLIDPDSTLFLYTDGLTEAENITHKLFGEERMMNIAIEAGENQHPLPLIEKMSEAVHDFVGQAIQSDDITMLAIQYTKHQLDVRLQRSITLPNDVEQVPQLAAFVDEVCEEVGFDMSLTMSLNLAIEEAVVNVMEYAYPRGVKGTVTIEAKANDERLKFVIRDSGKPFDPTAKAETDTTLSAEERPIGGLGIHLVRQIMDSINYERIQGENVLTLRKKLQTDGI